MRISDWSSDVCSSDLPSARTRSRMPSPSSTVRSTVTVSIGGADAVKGRRGSMERNAAATRPRRTIGSATQLSVRSAIAHLEEAHPAELDELRLMSMEHVQAWFVVGERRSEEHK